MQPNRLIKISKDTEKDASYISARLKVVPLPRLSAVRRERGEIFVSIGRGRKPQEDIYASVYVRVYTRTKCA